MCEISDAIKAISLLNKRGKLSGWAKEFTESVVGKTQCGKFTGCCSEEMCYHIYRIYKKYHSEVDMKHLSIGNMLKQCGTLLSTGAVTEWERNFIQHLLNITEQGDDTRDLSEKQVECILTIFNKNFSA